jgi:hypothetical protein
LAISKSLFSIRTRLFSVYCLWTCLSFIFIYTLHDFGAELYASYNVTNMLIKSLVVLCWYLIMLLTATFRYTNSGECWLNCLRIAMMDAEAIVKSFFQGTALLNTFICFAPSNTYIGSIEQDPVVL